MSKKCTILIGFLFYFNIAQAQNSIGALGTWREHYNNQALIQVVKGDKLYGASQQQILSIDTNLAIEYISKSGGLHEVGIKKMKWHESSQQLVIAYQNNMIDILQGDQIHLINDINLSNQYVNSTINDICFLNNWGLISTSFGIVVIDLIRHEIKDTWFPNNNRQATATFQVAIKSDSLFAVTENGIWRAALKNNWLVSNQWEALHTFDTIKLEKIISHNNIVYACNKKMIYQLPHTTPVVEISKGNIHSIQSSKDGVIVLLHDNDQKGSLMRLNTDLSTSILIDSSILGIPMAADFEQGVYWVADSLKGLLKKDMSEQWIQTTGPKNDIKGSCTIQNEKLIAPFGTSSIGFAIFDESGWKNYTSLNNKPLLHFSHSLMTTKVPTIWLTSGKELMKIQTSNNSIESIVPSVLDGDLFSLQTDPKGIVWVLQDKQGLLSNQNTNWTLHAPPSSFLKNGLSQFIFSRSGQAWLIAPNHEGIYIYQPSEYYGTNQWTKLTTAKGGGNLPSNFVTSLTEDKLGSIWVGTNNGIGIFNCGDITQNSCDAFIPIVKNNGFYGNLFQNAVIHAIAIDGANRKWIGTNDGAWLLSSDGLSILKHFTAANSPLPNDTIKQILIHPTTGEIFFNTPIGIISYRGNATDGVEQQASIQIFPNPVAPDYNGTITFKGLVENAIVKITDINGRLVFQTRALGGQAIWNGITYEGNKIASGIYLVFVRDEAGNEKNVGKLAITKGY